MIMSIRIYFALVALAFVAEGSLQAAAGSTGRTLLQPRTKLVAQRTAYIAGLAAACPENEDCFDYSVNFSWDKSKKEVSSLVASGTFVYTDATGAGGYVGGACSAQAASNSDPRPVLSWTKNSPSGLKEVKAELRWASQAVCERSSLPVPPVPSGEKMLYYGGACEVLVYEWSSSKPGQYCNNRYVGQTFAEINYDDKQPPNTKQAGKTQVWYCKGLRFDGGVCDNNCS
ncbi:hypothetical protein OEZ85_011430 [Tetradesmus obliquus]|uniref:Ig-like domain-containing protein n=1 Tax=Tetradesmus obliquus TaxID=3088 RepID=A0ABY8TQL5_TETOB|nr:hypothetical protein OEZ85_011430 [Tetradesmus obliquus]